MSKPHFSNYVSPNIVIVPTVSFCEPPPKRPKFNAQCHPMTKAITALPIAETNQTHTSILPTQNITTNAECQPVPQYLPVASVGCNNISYPTMSAMENVTNEECLPPQQVNVIPIQTDNFLYETIFPMENISNDITFPVDNITDNIPIQENPLIVNKTEDASKNNLDDTEQRVKKTLSWASNYLHSIGQFQPKATKLTISAHQKVFPKIEESKHQNANKNLFKPTFKHLDFAQNHQNLYTNTRNNIAQMQSNASTNEDNNKGDTKATIKINLLSNKGHIKTYSDKLNTQKTINNPETQNFLKPTSEIRTEYNSKYSNTESNKKNIEHYKYPNSSNTRHFENSFNEKRTNNISTLSHTQLLEIKNTDKDKQNKDTNRNCTPNISKKSYTTDESKDRQKDIKILSKSKNCDNNYSSQSRYKTKHKLEETSSDRIKRHSKRPTYSSSSIPLSKNSKTEPKRDKIKLKSREHSYAKKDKVDDSKRKSKSSTKLNNNVHKIVSKSSKKLNENYINKASEMTHSAPVKSVVKVTKKYDLDNPKPVPENDHIIDDLRSKLSMPDNFHNVQDLRTKLSRKYKNPQSTKRDNLIVTVQNDNNDEDLVIKQPTSKEKNKLVKKTRKYKKIKLVINVVCEKCSESSESDSDIDNDEEYPLGNVDLSFLDDFDVDDIVDSLNDQEKKLNVNVSPLGTTDSKKSIITEKDVGKQKFINENNKDPQERLLTELPEDKIDVKKEEIATEIKQYILKNNNDENFSSSGTSGNVIQTPNNTDPFRKKTEKHDIGCDLNTVIATETSNKKNISPTQPNQHVNLEKKSHINNLTSVSEECENEPKYFKIHKDTTPEIVSIKSRPTQIDTNKVITIDLTQKTDTSVSLYQKNTSSTDIVDTKLLKQTAEKQHKLRNNSEINVIIDLTDTTLKTEVDTSAKPTCAQHIEIKQSKMHNNKTELNKNTSIAAFSPLSQQKKTKLSMTKIDGIIDLTLLTETNPIINSQDIKSVDIDKQALEVQQHSIEVIKKDITVTPDYNITTNRQHKADATLSNIAALKNNIGENIEDLNTMNLQTSKIGANRHHYILSNNAEIKIVAEEHSVKDKNMYGATAVPAPKVQNNRATEKATNNLKMKNEIESITVGNFDCVEQKSDIAAGLWQNKINDKILLNDAKVKKNANVNPIRNDMVNDQVTEISLATQHEENCNLSNNATVQNFSQTVSDFINQTTGIAHEHKIKQTSTSKVATDNIHAAKSATSTSLDAANEASFNNNMNAKPSKASLTPNYKMKIASSAACPQIRSNRNTPDKEEQAKNIKDTALNNKEDVLSLTDSLDENLTSYNSSDSDETVTKTLDNVDKKEATTNEMISESKVIEIKKRTSCIDDNEDKCDSAVTVKLENRMLEYFSAKYSIEYLINHGKFSKIYLCKDENGRNYALKVLNKGKRIAGCQTEDMLKDLQRDIPRKNYHCVFLVDGFAMLDQWCFLMDFYPKNMQEVLYENGKCFHIDVVQVLARQLISAVLILRNHNIMHLDIKPSHILMNTSNDRLKLAGFDESKYLEGLSVLPCIGTVNYRPPEVILGFPYFGKIDVWSTALVIYEMCTARQLFPGCYNNDILYKQMCTLGNIPNEMVMQSVFTNYHYRGAYFARRYGPGGQQFTIINTFRKSMRLATSLFEAYHRDWEHLRTRRQKTDDSIKLRVLRSLLEDMLTLDPTRRTPIEFVYVNSFIYETFDSSV